MAHPTVSVTAVELLGGTVYASASMTESQSTVTCSRCCGDRFSTRSATTRQSSAQ
jgi:hypothetical protein